MSTKTKYEPIAEESSVKMADGDGYYLASCTIWLNYLGCTIWLQYLERSMKLNYLDGGGRTIRVELWNEHYLGPRFWGALSRHNQEDEHYSGGITVRVAFRMRRQ